MHAKLKPILKDYQVKATIAIRHHNTICLDIKSGPIEFINSYNQMMERIGDTYRAETYIRVNPYHYTSHFSGKSRKFLDEVINILNEGNEDDWFVDVNIGKIDNPFIRTERVDIVEKPVTIIKRKRRKSKTT
jgi:hypothetical protein